MEQYLEVISVPAIATVVYWIIELLKYTTGGNEKFKKFIPLVSAVLAIICGVVCYFAIPSVIPAENVLVAILIGAASGLTATGFNQVVKQLKKGDGNE